LVEVVWVAVVVAAAAEETMVRICSNVHLLHPLLQKGLLLHPRHLDLVLCRIDLILIQGCTAEAEVE
jgi:hypothetical protein